MNKVKIIIMQIAAFCFAGQLFGEIMNENDLCTNHVVVAGTAKKVQLLEEHSSFIDFKVPVDIRFVNCSKNTIFIFQNKDGHYPWDGGSNVYDSKESVEQRKYLCTRGIWPSNSSNSETWQEIRNVLNVSYPPNEFIRVINPGESWDYEINVILSFEKGKARKSSGCESWDVIKEIDELWLQKTFLIWPFNIEKSFESREYGLSLRDKWKEKGYLILDNLVSEPIPIRLHEATIAD